MIDPSIYDLTEEQATLILNHYEILLLFYHIGLVTTLVVIIYYVIKGIFLIIKKIKDKRLKNDRLNL